MASFHETGYGRKFFDRQLPDLIKALNRVADALEAQNGKSEKEEMEKEKEEQRNERDRI